jgi:hypothetical protein
MTIKLETEAVDWRKHGRPFVRTFDRSGEGHFIEPVHTEWGKRSMRQWFTLEAEPGDLLQVRLDDGSWKNDAKKYVRIAPDGKLIDVAQDAAGRELAERKMAAAAKPEASDAHR